MSALRSRGTGALTRNHRHGGLETLEETLELLSNPAAMREIIKGREAAGRCEGIDAEADRQRYLRNRRNEN